MPELLLHYIWQKGLFRVLPQATTDGRRVEVLDVGVHNNDAGPDFSAATIRIDGITWTGNVEIHVRASDWTRHGHHNDAAYDNVILHVVKEADKEVFNTKGEALVQCELQYPDEQGYLEQMLADKMTLCSAQLLKNPGLLAADWKQILLRERLSAKEAAISSLLQLTNNGWEQAFYVTLAHNFGFHTNGLPFELLAKQTPLNYLLKHRSSVFQLEAMLFGQSGLLTERTATDEYSRKMWQEYSFLKKKFGLEPLDGSIWKMARMRPQNFPHIRIAQFAMLLHETEFLFSKIIKEQQVRELRQLLSVTPSEYWQTHYRFGAEVAEKHATIGKSAIDVLIINSVVPYQYAWGRKHNSLLLQENAMQLMQSMPAENNTITANWKLLGVRVKTAADSQALLQLYQDYCVRQRCLACDVGYQIFTPGA